jgi:uncharacterized Zn finger protein (UPF0148 family)
MAECSQCKTETELYHQGVPICPSCSDARESKASAMQQSATESTEASAQSNSSEYV